MALHNFSGLKQCYLSGDRRGQLEIKHLFSVKHMFRISWRIFHHQNEFFNSKSYWESCSSIGYYFSDGL